MKRSLPRPGGARKFVRLTRETYLKLAAIAERWEKFQVDQPLELRDMAGTPVLSLGGGGLPIVRVRPTATSTKSGTYTGFIRNAPTGAFDSTAAGTLAASDFGSNGAACTIINASEEGLTASHEITFDGSYLPLEFIGYIIGTDTGTGNPLVMAFMDQSEFCPA